MLLLAQLVLELLTLLERILFFCLGRKITENISFCDVLSLLIRLNAKVRWKVRL